MQLKLVEQMSPSTDWKPVKTDSAKISVKDFQKTFPSHAQSDHSLQALNCSWNSQSADLPDIEACNVVWDSKQQHSTQLVNTCQGVIHAESTQNTPLFVCGDNTNQGKTASAQMPSQYTKTSICLRRRRLSNCSMERHVRDRFLAEIMSRTSTPVHDCDYWIDRSASYFNLAEVDLSRNRLTQLPSCIVSIANRVKILNLSHNRFTEFPEELNLFTSLEVLDLSHNTITGGLPKGLPKALTRLKVLRLHGNQITELPETLGEITQLETLILGSIFGGNQLQSFPEKCISRLVKLKELDLTQNLLVSLPSDIGHFESALERLAVSGNRLLSLPCSIGLCRLLRSLDLSRNSLLDLPIEITDLNGLETLDLTENKLCVIPGDIALFMSKTTVLLSGNPFTLGARRHEPLHADNDSSNRANTSLIQQLQSTSEQNSTSHFTQSNSISSSHLDQTSNNYTTLASDLSIAHSTSSLSKSLASTPNRSLLPSLREFAARKILKYAIPIPRYRLPTTLLRYLERGARPCCHCLNPYVREWISCVEVKNYLGHPKVPRSVRFCSATCMVQTNTPSDSRVENPHEYNVTQSPNQRAKASVKPFSSLLTQRSNQPPIKSKKPSSMLNSKRNLDRPITTDW
ncbi:hypothetical protein K7432_009557 [Basidiobolus ranarum]|uniref:L domain-like protein n=1 Tax=Basidiobolus ranarum TaxID=34480 RepID=A0ABR2WQ07_9FUNG